MKNLSILVFAVMLLVTANSCKSVYRCGDLPTKPGIFWGKRLKAVVNERDTLCSNLTDSQNQINRLRQDTTVLGAQNAALRSTLDQLQGNYDALDNAKTMQADELNRALQAKSDELNDKEKLLLEREQNLRELRQTLARQDSISSALKDVLRNALLGFNPDELSVENRDGKVYVSMSDKLLFKSGSIKVEDKGVAALKMLAEVLLKNPDIQILVEGHTDNVPIKTAIFADNWDLSVMRATSIVRILAKDYKVPARRLTASGRGEFYPKADNATPEGRAQNRRTEIILSPNLDDVMKLLK